MNLSPKVKINMEVTTAMIINNQHMEMVIIHQTQEVMVLHILADFMGILMEEELEITHILEITFPFDFIASIILKI